MSPILGPVLGDGARMVWRRILVLVCAVMLAGCLPVTSKAPVGTTTGLGADKALVGAWKGNNPGGKDFYFVHFLANEDGGMKAVIVSNGGGDDVTILRVQTAKLGKNHYLNAVLLLDNDKPVEGAMKFATIPLRYVEKHSRLMLYMLDQDKVKAAIRAGKLKGTIEEGTMGDAVITEEAATLDAFFAKPEGAALFTPYKVMWKVE